MKSILFGGVIAQDYSGLTSSDCFACSSKSNTKYCIPYEYYQGQGWCCDLNDYVDGKKYCAINDGLLCSDMITKEEGKYKDP